MRIDVLGPLRVRSDGSEIRITGPRARRALVALAAAGRDGLTVDALADAIWDTEQLPVDHIGHVRTVISRLRRSLADRDGSVIVTEPGRYVLGGSVDVDAQEFLELIDLADEIDASRRVLNLAAALELWRGGPFGEFGDRDAFAPQAHLLEERRFTTVEWWAEASMDAGQPDGVIGPLHDLVEEQPYREDPARLLATALYQTGRQAEALRALAAHRRLMRDDLGVDPSPDFDVLERMMLDHDPSVASAVAPHRRLRSYRLGPVVRRRGASVVHRATQPSLDRPVAVEILGAEVADDPSVVAQFQIEAERVARVEHPHIAPLHDYWREPHRAILVSRLFDTWLDDIVDRGPLLPEQTWRIVHQVGSALVAAHKLGVVHGSLSTGSVALDEIGNAYLVDLGSSAAFTATKPQPVADTRALVLLAAQCLAGDRRLDPARASVTFRDVSIPPAATALIGQVLDSAGLATIEDLLAVVPSAGSEVIASTRSHNPFVGMASFGIADADDFAGREDVVDDLRRRLEGGASLLVLTGPSGVGKSSIVHAGLIARLARDGLPGRRLHLTSMRPGARPHESLVEALRTLSTEPAESATFDDSGLASLVRSTTPAGTEVVLVIDQLEELLDPMIDAATRERFLDGVLSAVSGDLPFRVVATVRADQLTELLGHPGVAERLGDSIVPIGPLTPANCARAITVPAGRAGVSVEPALVAALVAEHRGNPGSLPLIQLTLTRLYDRTDGSTLRYEDLEEMGGVAGALVAQAETFHSSLSEPERDDFRSLVRSLMTVRGDGPVLRRRVPLSSTGATVDLARRAAASRLLTLSSDPVTRAPAVEIAHEALFDAWPRLRTWLSEDREVLAVQDRLRTAVRLWLDADRSEAALLRGRPLEDADRLVSDRRDELTSVELEFVESSAAARERVEVDEHRRRRRLAVLAATASVIAIVALVAGGLATAARRDADGARENEAAARSRAETDNRSLQIASLANGAQLWSERDPSVALQLGVAAVDAEPSARSIAGLAAALNAEPRLVATQRRLDRSVCTRTSRSGNGGLAAAVDESGASSMTVTMTSLDDGRELTRQAIDGSLGCATPASDGSAVLVAAEGGVRIHGMVDQDARGRPVDALEAVWSPEGDAVVTVSAAEAGETRLAVLDPSTLEPEYESTIAAFPKPTDLAVSSHGMVIAVVGDQFLASLPGARPTSYLFDSAAERFTPLDTGAFQPFSVAVSEDGRVVVAAGRAALWVWDGETGERLHAVALAGVSNDLTHVALNPRGDVAALSTTRGVELIDTRTGVAFGPPLTVAGPSTAPQFIDDSTVVVHVDDVMPSVFDIRRRFGIAEPVRDVAAPAWIGPEARTIVEEGDPEGYSSLTNLETGERWTLGRGNLVVRPVDARTVVGFHEEDWTFRRWVDGEPDLEVSLADILPKDDRYFFHQVRVDGPHVAVLVAGDKTGSFAENQALVFDWTTGEPVRIVEAPGAHLAELTGAGRLLLASVDGPDRLVDLRTGDEQPVPSAPSVVASAYGLSSGSIALGLEDGTVLRYDPVVGSYTDRFTSAAGLAVYVTETDDGLVVVHHESGAVTLRRWDDPLEVVVRSAEESELGGRGVLVPAGDELYVVDGDTLLRIPLAISEWRAEACRRGGNEVDGRAWEAATGLEPPTDSPCAR